MSSIDDCPLGGHPLDEPTAFSPLELVQAVRQQRSRPNEPIPEVCVLDFDGDLTDWLLATGRARSCPAWACFHTEMAQVEVDGMIAGVVARTIGGPYAVLVAEQMLVQGAQVVVGLTSAGRISPDSPVPGLVVPRAALRDEGTSLHYLPASRMVDGPAELGDALAEGASGLGLKVTRGAVWTTDAPYRETAAQIRAHAEGGIAAVEMQAASLFALAQARDAAIGVVAHVTNATDHGGEAFDKGDDELSFRILAAIVRAGYGFLRTRRSTGGS